jgi:nicotinamidase/pyrazinamidase
MRALLVVDIQEDFLPWGALPVKSGDEVVSVANRLLAERARLFDFVVGTQDWHPPGHKSFASSHKGRNVGEIINLHGIKQFLWPDHCVQRSHGADFADGLMTSQFDLVTPKGTNPDVDSYSGFFDNERRGNTGLNDWLKDRNVDHVTVLGLATDYCVKYTVQDALLLGFKVDVVMDGCRAVNIQDGDDLRAFDFMRGEGARLVHLKDALNSKY